MKDLVYGKMTDTPEFRASAVFVAGWDAMLSGHGIDYYFPVFANAKEDHEVRIGKSEADREFFYPEIPGNFLVRNSRLQTLVSHMKVLSARGRL